MSQVEWEVRQSFSVRYPAFWCAQQICGRWRHFRKTHEIYLHLVYWNLWRENVALYTSELKIEKIRFKPKISKLISPLERFDCVHGRQWRREFNETCLVRQVIWFRSGSTLGKRFPPSSWNVVIARFRIARWLSIGCVEITERVIKYWGSNPMLTWRICHAWRLPLNRATDERMWPWIGPDINVYQTPRNSVTVHGWANKHNRPILSERLLPKSSPPRRGLCVGRFEFHHAPRSLAPKRFKSTGIKRMENFKNWFSCVIKLTYLTSTLHTYITPYTPLYLSSTYPTYIPA